MEKTISQEIQFLDWNKYKEIFEDILSAEKPMAPYDNPAYFDYLKLNASRQKRWLKVGKLNLDLVEKLKQISKPLDWILITEPWCGDAAHSNPFIQMLSEVNPLINLKIFLRDTPPFLIDNYLTNGGKSIPKLIVRDAQGKDIFNWGPRPKECQTIYDDLKTKNATFEEQKIILQNWYNKDKGVSLQEELLKLF